MTIKKICKRKTNISKLNKKKYINKSMATANQENNINHTKSIRRRLQNKNIRVTNKTNKILDE